jgi:hypothetical protein
MLFFVLLHQPNFQPTNPPTTSHPTPSLQQGYEDYSALGVHWLLFGSSGHKTRPDHGGVLRNYYKRLPLMHGQHTLIKTIANTRWRGMGGSKGGEWGCLPA